MLFDGSGSFSADNPNILEKPRQYKTIVKENLSTCASRNKIHFSLHVI